MFGVPVPIHSLGCTGSRAIPQQARHRKGFGRSRGDSDLYLMGVFISSRNTSVLWAQSCLCLQSRDTAGYQCWVPGRPGGPSVGPPTGWVLGRRLFTAGSLKSTAKTRGYLKSTIKAAAECFLHPKITAIFLNYSFAKNCRVPPAPPSSLVKATGAARGLEDHTTSHPSLPGWVSRCPPRSTVPTPVSLRSSGGTYHFC